MSLVKNIGIGRSVLNFSYGIDINAYDVNDAVTDYELWLLERYKQLDMLPTKEEIDKAIRRYNTFDIDASFFKKFEIDTLNRGLFISVAFSYKDRNGQGWSTQLQIMEIFDSRVLLHKFWKEYASRLESMGYKELASDDTRIKLVFDESC